MGVVHRAKLFYGFAISEDVEKKWLMEDKYADPIVYYAQKKGVAFPDLPYVGNKLLYDQYWEKVQAFLFDIFLEGRRQGLMEFEAMVSTREKKA